MTPERLEVVVARFQEDVGWTRNLPAGTRIAIYGKGGEEGAGAGEIALPNIGREAHTYLWHIVHRYDSLAPVTVFCQGHPFDHAHDLHRVIRGMAAGSIAVSDFLWLGFIIDTDDPRGGRLFVPWSRNPQGRELPLAAIHESLFGEPCPDRFLFYPGAQFAVSASCIRRRPLEFYRRALGLAAADELHAHCFERIWDRVFDQRGVDEGAMGGADTRYLKPIRRLGGMAALAPSSDRGIRDGRRTREVSLDP